ncbi:unnamed protein product [Boreogadus saida]
MSFVLYICLSLLDNLPITESQSIRARVQTGAGIVRPPREDERKKRGSLDASEDFRGEDLAGSDHWRIGDRGICTTANEKKRPTLALHPREAP